MTDKPNPDDVSAALIAIQRLLGDNFQTLSTEEVKGLRDILDYKEDLVSMMRYRAANQIIINRWRGAIIAMAALITAMFVIWDKFLSALGSAIK